MMMICKPEENLSVAPASSRRSSGGGGGGGGGVVSAAPGFRFQPTDEELVTYYLKRKVTGRPLVVDAIAEVDLYKLEPWDLPSLSRLNTRDQQWYFFSALGTKYANRPSQRTNRATTQGYWKTTGKDRPVHHASRVVGFKKTLVFHIGRAPRGKRTNWVMHEYRLEEEPSRPQSVQSVEDDVLGSSDAPTALAIPPPQNSFVLCRVFEKSGSGPQNGAQYGAPFIEEEWEQAEVIKCEPAVSVPLLLLPPPPAVEQDYDASSDEKQAWESQRESTLVPESGTHDSGTYSEDPSLSFEGIFDLDTYLDGTGQLDADITNIIGENSGMGSDQNDGYMELKDIVDSVNGQVQNASFCLNTANEAISTKSPLMCPPVRSVFKLQSGDFLSPAAGDYSSSQPTEDEFYYAPNTGDVFTDLNDNELPSVSDFINFDMINDDWVSYNVDGNLSFDDFDSSEKLELVSAATMVQPNFVSEVKDVSFPTCKAMPQVVGMSTEMVASSSARSIGTTNQLENMNASKAAGQDMPVNEGWTDTLRRRLVDMLGSIDAPPAMAEISVEGKAIGVLSATNCRSSINVSAGLIQIHGMSVAGSRDAVGKEGAYSSVLLQSPLLFESSAKMQGGGFGMLLRGGFWLIGLAAVVLSATVGMCVYNK